MIDLFKKASQIFSKKDPKKKTDAFVSKKSSKFTKPKEPKKSKSEPESLEPRKVSQMIQSEERIGFSPGSNEKEAESQDKELEDKEPEDEYAQAMKIKINQQFNQSRKS